MIQERGEYKSLDPADILERLNTHEFQLAEKRDLYGPRYGGSRALKAKAVSESEGEDSGSSLGDPEELSQELAILVRKFQKFSRRGRFGKSSRNDDVRSDSSSRDYKKRTCHKCKKPGHYIQDCPLWEKESNKKKYKDYSSDDSKKKKKSSKSSSSKSSKSSSHKKSSSKKARAFIVKEMDSEAESEENEEEEASEE
uniref:Gag polyprotein n=1 Tax=Triticum aestivum TaxID=4565 RepID=Q8H1T0_WHEAT|nr:gag polyprotein [Triticum aestivum]